MLTVGLQRAVTAYADREKQLRQEIADREAELSDVIQASRAATAALVEMATKDIDASVVEDEG